MLNNNEMLSIVKRAGERAGWLKSLEPRIASGVSHGHWGLWLDKMSMPFSVGMDAARKAAEDEGRRTNNRDLKIFARSIPSGKLASLVVATRLFSNDRHSEHYKKILLRNHSLRVRLEENHGKDNVRIVVMRGVERLLMHLARSNPLENVGLCADRISGLPVIPGTSLKGVVSTWACWSANIREDGSFPDEKETIKERRVFSTRESEMATRILGDNSDDGSEGAGEVVFLGGTPLDIPALEVDITTPHQGESPVPSPFLAVGPGVDWAFTFVARPRSGSDSKVLLDQAEKWVRESLSQLGIGSKTAAGYGRFRDLTEPEMDEARRRMAETAEAVEARIAALDGEAVARERVAAAAKAEAERRSKLDPEDLAAEEYWSGTLPQADKEGAFKGMLAGIEKLDEKCRKMAIRLCLDHPIGKSVWASMLLDYEKGLRQDPNKREGNKGFKRVRGVLAAAAAMNIAMGVKK